jgi:hypothetical protein
MTTKQGLLYNKQKSKKIIETMTNPNTLSVAQKVNPQVYKDVYNGNTLFASEALQNCKNSCDSKYSDNERDACYLGCDIKNLASSEDDLFLSIERPFNNPYDKIKKSFKKTVEKNSDEKIVEKHIKWDPRPTYGQIPDGTKRVRERYKTTSTYYKNKEYCRWIWWQFKNVCRTKRIPYKKTVYKYRWKTVPKTKWGIIKPGKSFDIPAVWEKCNWTETLEYPEENVGTFNKQINVNSCDDFITNENTDDDINPSYYRDYSKHELDDACKHGMDTYERENYIVNENKKSYDGTTKYGSLSQDKNNLDQSLDKYNKHISEGFSNACKSKCSEYIEGQTDIDKMNTNAKDQCYDCEVIHNVFIRNEKARTEWLDTFWYTATTSTPVDAKLNDLSSKHNLKKNKLKEIYHIDNTNNETGTYADLKKKYKVIFDKINAMTHSEKKNATINAYLEDINKRTPGKNIEYGIWLGLLVAAGIITTTLIKD